VSFSARGWKPIKIEETGMIVITRENHLDPG